MINRYLPHINARISQWRYFAQPYNSWGKWILCTPAQQYAGLLLLFTFLSSFPAYQYWKNCRSLTENFIELQQKQEQFTHQSRLLAALQQKNQRHLNKAVTAKLATFHQKIQSFAVGLSIIHSQWQVQNAPGLDLKVQGHFAEIQQFLTALLQQIPELALLSWHIQKIEENDENHRRETGGGSSIESSLSFRLHLSQE
ncbi:hypothetical protein CBG46_01825 [Actinobacillus succinogenes]|uniref:Competence C protein, putative n=1 Tax=Actinobacillus succinogenes (strain ATCC 55618 / DSM 22257 / CCUG 43843 / 130Z) TaxID=339671 RepID=A6VM66_ACTSZ|nr:hypothetical protein [Actinobacillus succinogenes]ABR74063.1 competence C protein, putative [Actinobacillus succinogenes 130Z]PHI39503.1 hypothetical protein CBG46_01825 [Actinobacillus succinogenes]